MPTQLHDMLMAYEWAYEHASEIGGDQSKYFSFGGSAGGTLALGVALKLIDAGKRSMIAGVVSLVPSTLHPENVPEAFKAKYKAAEENKDAPVLDGESLKFFMGKPLPVNSFYVVPMTLTRISCTDARRALTDDLSQMLLVRQRTKQTPTSVRRCIRS